MHVCVCVWGGGGTQPDLPSWLTVTTITPASFCSTLHSILDSIVYVQVT